MLPRPRRPHLPARARGEGRAPPLAACPEHGPASATCGYPHSPGKELNLSHNYICKLCNESIGDNILYNNNNQFLLHQDINVCLKNLRANINLLTEQKNDAEQTLANQHARFKQLEAEVALCVQHQPSSRARSFCVICSINKLEATLSAISYALGEPNELQVSAYSVDYNEEAVLRNVRNYIATKQARITSLECLYDNTFKHLRS